MRRRVKRKRVSRTKRLEICLDWVRDKLEKELACRQHTLKACIYAIKRARKRRRR